MGKMLHDGKTIQLSGNSAIMCTLSKSPAASTAHEERGMLFVNMKEAHVIYLILTRLRHPQSPTRINIDNTTTIRIVNRIIKRSWPLSTKIQQQGFLINLAYTF